MKQKKEESKKRKLIKQILFSVLAIILIIILILLFKNVYNKLKSKKYFENDITSFSEKNKNTIFSINKIMFFSSCDSKNKTTSQTNFTIENLYAYTDIAIFIDNNILENKNEQINSESNSIENNETNMEEQKETLTAENTLKNVKYIAAEDTRNTVKLLNHFEISTKLISHHEHNIKQSIPKLIQLLEEGNDIALVSDAGYPAISDPGYELVKEAIEHEINVVPISGCNACLDALVVSGIAPQPFMFYGFLDHLDKKKKKELIDLKKYKETIVFYESPHRIKKTLNLMLDILGDRNIALCREITKKHEEIIRGHISEIISILEELKGEMVIVVEGSQEVEEEITFETTIKEDVDMYIEKGMSTKDAIKEVAKQRNLNKNSVYQEYHSK